jgi:hypothetical protein
MSPLLTQDLFGQPSSLAGNQEIGMVENPSLTGVIVVIVLVSCYFMPTIIALVCDKRGASGVALVNFFLGWTVIGWFAALIWSCTGKTRANDRREPLLSPLTRFKSPAPGA